MDRLSGEGREAHRGPQIWDLGRSWEQGLEVAALAACCLLSAPLRFPGAQPPRWPSRSSAPGPDHISIRALPVLLGSRVGRGAGPKRGCCSPSLWALGEGVAPRGPL